MPCHSKGWKRPINIKFGENKIKLGYDIRRPDGTDIWAAVLGEIGLHISFHPSGIIKVSDNTGFESRCDLNDLEITNIEPGYIEELFVEYIEQEYNPTGESMAIVPTSGYIQPIRKNRWFVDIDVLGSFESILMNNPIWQIEEDYIDNFIEKKSEEGTIIFSPESEQFAVVLDDKGSIFPLTFKNDYITRLMGLSDFLPGLESFGSLLNDSFDHLKSIFEEEKYGFQNSLQCQFEQIDFDRVIQQYLPRFEKLVNPDSFIKKYNPC